MSKQLSTCQRMTKRGLPKWRVVGTDGKRDLQRNRWSGRRKKSPVMRESDDNKGSDVDDCF